MRIASLPRLLAVAAAALFAAAAAQAASVSGVQFVNGLALEGGALDQTPGAAIDRRLGYFSDMYYDPIRNEWWGLSDRGPGGGLLNYETRVQRFTVDVATNGAISNFQVAETVKFSAGGLPLNGIAPNPAGQLGRSFDPEGLVVLKSGNFLVSDEYGPSLYEFDRSGQMVRQFNLPAHLVPKVSGTTNYNALPPTLTSGREPNRGFEGLAVSPDGKYAYAMLQNGTIQDGWSPAGGGTRGQYTRIVKFDIETGEAVAQYAYKLESSGQGRGISALVALGDDRFLVLERNNRGVGVGANIASPDKNVFEISLAGAMDVSNVALPASGDFAGAVTKVAKVMDLDAHTLAALGNKSPEKWEGLAIGPQLANGMYLMLAGTDNDYSVTQTGAGEQFDVYFRFGDADPYGGSIQCPIGSTLNCFYTTGGASATLGADYALLPGVLHAYVADIAAYVAPIDTPPSVALALLALGLLAGRRRRGGEG